MHGPPNSKAFISIKPSPGVHRKADSANLILLTITTDRRNPWLTNETVLRLIHQTWSEATAWMVGEYLLMPDHVHCFCAPGMGDFSIERWISYWKRAFAMKHQQPNWKFQSRGWHHRLRHDESYSEKWLYVQENPIRKHLCHRMEDWPYKGKVFDLLWSGN